MRHIPNSTYYNWNQNPKKRIANDSLSKFFSILLTQNCSYTRNHDEIMNCSSLKDKCETISIKKTNKNCKELICFTHNISK